MDAVRVSDRTSRALVQTFFRRCFRSVTPLRSGRIGAALSMQRKGSQPRFRRLDEIPRDSPAEQQPAESGPLENPPWVLSSRSRAAPPFWSSLIFLHGQRFRLAESVLGDLP